MAKKQNRTVARVEQMPPPVAPFVQPIGSDVTERPGVTPLAGVRRTMPIPQRTEEARAMGMNNIVAESAMGPSMTPEAGLGRQTGVMSEIPDVNSQGATSDQPEDLNEWHVEDLRDEAARLNISGRSSMNKEELVTAIEEARKQ